MKTHRLDRPLSSLAAAVLAAADAPRTMAKPFKWTCQGKPLQGSASG
jgi:hypothetical protein